MYSDLHFSRSIATAYRLGDLAQDKHRFTDKKVLITGEAPVLSTENGRMCLFNSIRLLVRVSRNITISLPPGLGDIVKKCEKVVGQIKYDQNVEFCASPVNAREYDAILNVGSTACPELPWTVINSNGWLARVSSGNKALPSDCYQSNPIGALAAASLGVSEIFKRLIFLKRERGSYFNGLSFSLYTYRYNDVDTGPGLPSNILLDIHLYGVGAIGNGVVYLLGELPISGVIKIVDRQIFQFENLGTCLLVGPGDLEVGKALFCERYLNKNGFHVSSYTESIQEFSHKLGSDIEYPTIVLNALDNIDARHAVQDLWPDLIVDGAIGDFGCQVSCHPWGEDTACLRCLYKKPLNESSDEMLSKLTGLSKERTQDALTNVIAEDVEQAPKEKQAWLSGQVGKQICSVIQEAVTNAISIEEQEKGFEPSVPFVACMSACMMVSELIKNLVGDRQVIETRYQMDVLHGPQYGMDYPQERTHDCICVTRSKNINKVRKNRVNVSMVES